MLNRVERSGGAGSGGAHAAGTPWRRGVNGGVRQRIVPIVAIVVLTLSMNAWAGNDTVESRLGASTDTFEQILEKRRIRALVVYNKIQYFLDGPTQRGLAYDALEQFREFVDKKYGFESRRFQVVYIPVTRDALIPAQVEGVGDIAVANLTVTPERLGHIDFTDPVATGVREIVVTAPGTGSLQSVADLAGMRLYVRESSSYYQSLLKLNEQFADDGLDPVEIVLVDEFLEDGDLFEMVNAGLLSGVVVDSHKADFWADVFENIVVHRDVAVSGERAIAWGMRKGDPGLAEVLNEFVAANRKGTMIGNILYKRYLKDNKWARNALDEQSLARYAQTVEYFKKYADQYGFDWLMLTALGYQESRLDQETRSAAGAVGVMQLLPSTAADPNVGIPDIHDLENNIHAGAKYLRFLRDRYFPDADVSELNKTLLTFASYNAGPAKVARLRGEAADNGLDPNTWFGHVEHIAARRIGRETVQYVGNISKYYVAYRILADQQPSRAGAREQLEAVLD